MQIDCSLQQYAQIGYRISSAHNASGPWTVVLHLGSAEKGGGKGTLEHENTQEVMHVLSDSAKSDKQCRTVT